MSSLRADGRIAVRGSSEISNLRFGCPPFLLELVTPAGALLNRIQHVVEAAPIELGLAVKAQGRLKMGIAPSDR